MSEQYKYNKCSKNSSGQSGFTYFTRVVSKHVFSVRSWTRKKIWTKEQVNLLNRIGIFQRTWKQSKTRVIIRRDLQWCNNKSQMKLKAELTVETWAQTETGCREEIRRARNWQTEFVNHDIRPHTHSPAAGSSTCVAFFHSSLSLHSL